MTDMTLDEAVKWLRDHVGDLRSAARVLRESPWGAKLAATAAEVDKAADEATLAIAALEAARAEAGALREALEDIRSRSSIDLAMRSDQFELTARLGDIHQIADAALANETKA
ncbi:MAG: hypothetical protein RBR77_04300 [Thauera sp.]|nr:hypothetical protein [Thauera sp.]